MTIRHLKIFVAVCEHGGITRAAEAMHIAQPAVSHTIAEMEKYYKVALFDRINQRLILTEMGQELLIKAKEILAGFDDFEGLAFQGSDNPTLRLGSSLTLGKTVLPHYLKRLKKEIPVISPTVLVNKTAMIEKELESGNLDFAMVEGTVSSPHLRTIPFGGDSITAVCAADYPAPDTLTLAGLTAFPILLRENGSASRSLLERELSLKRLSVLPYMESVSNSCIISALEAGLGVAVLPEGLVLPLIHSGVLKRITVSNTDFRRVHSLVMHKNKRLNPLQSRAFALCRAFYSETQTQKQDGTDAGNGKS